MMGTLKLVFDSCFKILQIRFSIGGYSFSLFNVLLFVMVGMIIMGFIFRFFGEK